MRLADRMDDERFVAVFEIVVAPTAAGRADSDGDRRTVAGEWCASLSRSHAADGNPPVPRSVGDAPAGGSTRYVSAMQRSRLDLGEESAQGAASQVDNGAVDIEQHADRLEDHMTAKKT